MVQTHSMWGRKSRAPPAGLPTVSVGFTGGWGVAPRLRASGGGNYKSMGHHLEPPETCLLGDSRYLGLLGGAVHR